MKSSPLTRRTRENPVYRRGITSLPVVTGLTRKKGFNNFVKGFRVTVCASKCRALN